MIMKRIILSLFGVILSIAGIILGVFVIALSIDFLSLVLGNTEGYPWGCKCFSNMSNYSDPETYLINEGIVIIVIALLLVGIFKVLKQINNGKKDLIK